MEYLTTKEASEKWNISERRVRLLCSEGKINGANQIGRQWLIPISAEKPVDRRTKKGKSEKLEDNYHFPMLIHTMDYINRDRLDEDYKVILQAQILYASGDNLGSLKLCRQALVNDLSLNLKIGIYITMCYDCLLIGLLEELKVNISILEKLFKEDKYHQEDYKLLLAVLYNYTGWDYKAINTIDVLLLSDQALTYYGTMMANSLLNSSKKVSSALLSSFEIAVRKFDTNHLDLDSISIHGILAILYRNNGDMEKCKYHNNRMCDIAVSKGYYGYLGMYYFRLDNLITDYLQRNYPVEAVLSREVAFNNLRSWKIIACVNKFFENIIDFEYKEGDIFGLLSADFKPSEIPQILNISEEEFNVKIDKLCKKFNLNNENELITFSKNKLKDVN